MHLEAVIDCIWRYTWMTGSSELRDVLRDHHWVMLEIHLEPMIVRTWC